MKDNRGKIDNNLAAHRRKRGFFRGALAALAVSAARRFTPSRRAATSRIRRWRCAWRAFSKQASRICFRSRRSPRGAARAEHATLLPGSAARARASPCSFAGWIAA